MKIVVETCVAGACIDRTYRPAIMITKSGKRAAKSNPTPDAVLAVNQRNAEKALTRLINHNFVPGDWHLVLNYDGKEPSTDQAKKDKDKFVRKLKAIADKEGIDLKWIAVTEYKHARIHHHIICSHIAFEQILPAWTHGQVRPSVLNKTRNYYKLAEYLVKETSKTFREDGNVFKRRYTTSRNIVRPMVKKTVIDAREIPDPKALKGYYIDEDSVRRYENAITGLEHLEYIMVSMEEEPRLRRWYKGTVVKNQRNYNKLLRNEEQLGIALNGGDQ